MRQALYILASVGICASLAAAAERTQATAEVPQWENLGALDIIPCPKRIRLSGGRLSLMAEGKAMAVIVVPDKAIPKLRIGANEINDRVRACGDGELPVQTLSDFRRQPAGRNAIAIDVPELTGFSTGIERAQGYEIRTVKPQIVAISGADPQGMLYGCVTACALVNDLVCSCQTVNQDIGNRLGPGLNELVSQCLQRKLAGFIGCPSQTKTFS